VLGRGIAHLTIYLPALALYLIVLPRIYAFRRSGMFHKSLRSRPSFCWRRVLCGQAIGAWFHAGPKTATLLLLATSLPQFFTAGFAWPRRQPIPDAALARAGCSPPTPRLTASCVSTSWCQHLGGCA